MHNIIPVKIRPHLVPFFYQEFLGIEARYLNKKVKACKISMTSSIGKMFNLALEKVDYPEKPEKIEKYYLYLSISEGERKKANGKIYSCASGVRSFLRVPEKVAEDLNCVLEDQFRLSFVYAISWALKYNQNIKKDRVIADFMVEYSLDEFGFNLKSLVRMYDREIEKGARVSRMQNKFSNRVINYRS